MDETEALLNFAARCNVEVFCDSHGRECKMRVSCRVQDANGRIRSFDRTIDLVPIIEAIHGAAVRYHSYLHGEDSIDVSGFGSLWKRASRVAKRVGKSKAVRGLYRQAKSAVKPIAKKYGRALVSALPYGGAAVAAYDVVKAARAGDKKALAKVSQVSALANRGDPGAQKTAEIMASLSSMLTAKENAVAVSGWGYNVPFRSSLEALEMDRSNPRHVMRALYYRGSR